MIPWCCLQIDPALVCSSKVYLMADANHIESWTAEEVVAFLATLELDQYGDDFMGLW